MNTNKYHVSQCHSIVELIECYIIENQLKSHNKLPGERKLCALWDCNRVTLRSAFDYLEKEGKIYSIKGMGNYVAGTRIEICLTEFSSFQMQIRQLGLFPTNELISIEVKKATPKIAKYLELEIEKEIYEIVMLVHVEDQPVILETSYLDSEKCPDFKAQDLTRYSIYEILDHSYHIKIESGREEISITNADPLEAQLLEIADNAPLFYVKKAGCNVKGNPVVYSQAVVRSDKIQFASILK